MDPEVTPEQEEHDDLGTDDVGSSYENKKTESPSDNESRSDSQTDHVTEQSKRIYQNQKLKDNPFVKQDLLLMSTTKDPPRFASKSEIEKLKSQIDKEIASREKLQQQISKLKIETLVKKQQLDQTTEDLEQLKQTHTDLQGKYENLNNQLNKKIEENEQLSSKMDQIRTALLELKEKGTTIPSSIQFIFEFEYSKKEIPETLPIEETKEEEKETEEKSQEQKETDENSEENLQSKQRREVIQELLHTERNYIRDLNTTIKVYMEPLKESKLVSSSEITVVFSEIELLVPVNKELLSLLEKVIQLPDQEQMVGEVFLKMVEYFNMYSTYCTGQEDALNMMNKWLKNEKVKMALEEARKHPDCNRLNLESFIIKPVQRICKYPLLLREMIKSTPETHPDFTNLKNAYDKVGEVVAAINRRKNIVENQKKVKEIEQTILFPSSMEGVSLVSQTRQFLLEGELKLQSSPNKQTNRTVLLFNDVLILCRAWGKANKKWRFECDIPMQRLLLFDIKDDEKNYKFCFELVHTGTRTKYLMACKNNQEKEHWIESINNCLIEISDSLFCLDESAWRQQLREALIRYRQAAGLPV